MSDPKLDAKFAVSGIFNNTNYTAVTVKNKDNGESFVINFKDAKITGNESEWYIKDGFVYDKNGKTIEDNVIEVTRYQAALIKAAAKGDSRGEPDFLDNHDLNGAGYAEKAKAELQKAQSEFRLDNWDNYEEPIPAADAFEYGVFEAHVVNNEGKKGQLIIDTQPDAVQLPKQQKHWWQFWK